MSFNILNFAPIGNSSKRLSGVGTSTLLGAPSVYSYATADAKNTVTAAGYFNTLAATLKKGDLLYVVHGAGSGGTFGTFLGYVNANDGTTVDIVDGSVIATTDTY